MALGLLGLKVGMTQVFDEQGKMAPVTVIELGPCPVLQVRTPERDGFHAVQLGFKDKLRRKAIRAESGHVAENFSSRRRQALRDAGVEVLKKADCEPQRYIREFRLDKAPGEEAQVGALLTASQVFKPGQQVDVIGTSKGRGFTGVMKRHNFQGLPASHGVKKHHRSPGSVGSLASNRGSGRPKKGKRMPGQYGAARITVRNLRVVRIDEANNLLLVRGAVPGPNGGLIYIQPTNKKKVKLAVPVEQPSKKKAAAKK